MRFRSIQFLACSALLLGMFLSTQAMAQEAGYTLQFSDVKTPSKLHALKGMNEFVQSFFALDSRYTLSKAKTDKTTHTLEITFTKKKKNISGLIVASVVGSDPVKQSFTLPIKVNQTEAEAELSRQLRTLFDYKPAKRKVLLRIKANAAEGDADGAGIEDQIYQTINSEFEQVSANPYELPVKDEDVAHLFKGDKKRFAILKDKAGVDILIVGTINIPATKNLGGATENFYRGKLNAKIKMWDVKHNRLMSNLDMNFTGEGIFSELLYSLTAAAGDKIAPILRKDLGLPAPKTEEKP